MSPPPHQSRPPRKETSRQWWWSPSRTRPRKGGGRAALRIPLSRIGRRWKGGWNIGGKWRVGRARDLAHGTDSTETRHRRCRLIHPPFPPAKEEREEGRDRSNRPLCYILQLFMLCGEGEGNRKDSRYQRWRPLQKFSNGRIGRRKGTYAQMWVVFWGAPHGMQPE